MTSIYEKKISAEVRLIHAEQISLYKFHCFKKKQQTQWKTKQVKKDILNQWESMGIPKLNYHQFISCKKLFGGITVNGLYDEKLFIK